jgi:ubiquinone biosynthesis protein
LGAPQDRPNGGFEPYQERPPQSLLHRFLVTQRHLWGLLFGGGIAYVREWTARGQGWSLSIMTLRLLLFLVWPLLDRHIIQQPFPVQFRLRLEQLGPTYIKLGQILSLRQDLLPHSVTSELQNLLDRLPVVSFERYQSLIEADLKQPLGVAFAWIEPLPLGSASLAQIHRAQLRTGEEVVLKVIKPGVRETIIQDVTLLRLVGRVLQLFLARYQPQRIINEFGAYTLREVDLRFEADNAETFAANFRKNPDVCFPRIYREFSGESVLCMEYFGGQKPTAAAAAQLTPGERSRILDLGVGSIIQMIFHDGFFHADLHPGNLIIFEDLRIGFIDLGMVGRIEEGTRKAMLYYFYSLVMGDPENAARILAALALPGRNADLLGLRRELTDLNRRWVSASRFHRFSIAQLILRSINLAGRYRVYYPEEVILMTKALVTIEGLGNMLEPDLELVTVARRHIQQIIRGEFNPATVWRRALIAGPEFFDILQRSPMIVAHTLQRLERLNQMSPSSPVAGVKETVLAGFALVAVAVLVAAGAPWPAWLALLVISLILVIRGLR